MLTKHLLTVVVFLSLTACAWAAWEDTGAPVSPAPTQTYTQPNAAPTPRRQASPPQPRVATPQRQPQTGYAPQQPRRVVTPPQRQPQTGYAPQQPRVVPTQPRQVRPQPGYVQPRPRPPQPSPQPGFLPPDLYSPFLDAQVEPRTSLSLMYITGVAVNNSEDDLLMGEVECRFTLVEWRNVLAGDMTWDIRLKSVIFGSDANLAVMPTALLELPLGLDWTWRFLNGWSFQLGMRPGFYADAEALGDGFGIPFKGVFYYAATPEFSWMLGAEVRPGWNMVAMPLAGLAWEPADAFRLTLAFPQSTALVTLGPIGLYGTVAWRNTSYGMSGEEGDPEQLTAEDLLLGGGLQIAFSESFRMTFEGGLLMNRTLLAEGSKPDDELELDDAPYFRVSFGGGF